MPRLCIASRGNKLGDWLPVWTAKHHHCLIGTKLYCFVRRQRHVRMSCYVTSRLLMCRLPWIWISMDISMCGYQSYMLSLRGYIHGCDLIRMTDITNLELDNLYSNCAMPENATSTSSYQTTAHEAAIRWLCLKTCLHRQMERMNPECRRRKVSTKLQLAEIKELRDSRVPMRDPGVWKFSRLARLKVCAEIIFSVPIISRHWKTF